MATFRVRLTIQVHAANNARALEVIESRLYPETFDPPRTTTPAPSVKDPRLVEVVSVEGVTVKGR